MRATCARLVIVLVAVLICAAPSTSVVPMLLPPLFLSNGTTAQLIDASGEKVGFILQAGKTGNLHKIHFRLGTVTTGQTLKASLQDVSLTNGDPDETVDQSGTVAVADTDDNTWKVVTLGADRAVTQGNLLAVVIEFDTTTGNLEVLAGNTVEMGHWYADLKAGAGPTWAHQSRSPIVILEYDDGSFGTMPTGVVPGVPASIDFASNSTPDERGIVFVPSVPLRVVGAVFRGRIDTTGGFGPVDLVLYDSGSSVIGSASLDPDVAPQSLGDLATTGLFASAVALTANATYRIVLKPTTTTSIRLFYLDVGTAAHLQQVNGPTMSWSHTERTDAGAWTATTTRRDYISLLVSEADNGAGSGGFVGIIGGH